MNIVQDIIERIEARGLRIAIGEDGRACFRGDRKNVSPQLAEVVKKFKGEILTALQLKEEPKPRILRLTETAECPGQCPGGSDPACCGGPDTTTDVMDQHGRVWWNWCKSGFDAGSCWYRRGGEAWQRIPGREAVRPQRNPLLPPLRFMEDEDENQG